MTILIFGRKNQAPRIIPGVTMFRDMGLIFGWFRDNNKFGFGLTKKWMARRYTHVLAIDGHHLHHITGEFDGKELGMADERLRRRDLRRSS